MQKYDLTDEDRRAKMVDENKRLEKEWSMSRQKSKEKLKKDQDKNYWEKWKVKIVKDKGLGLRQKSIGSRFRMKMEESGLIDNG